MGIARAVGRVVGRLFRPAPKPPTMVETVTLPDLIGWFVENKEVKADNVIAFSLVHDPAKPPTTRLDGLPPLDLSSAGLVVVQGFYDQKSGRVLLSRALRATQIDDEVEETHAGKDMVVYQ